MRKIGMAVAAGFALWCGAAAETPREQADKMATDLVAKMTLDEKVGQLLNVAPAIPRLGIPRFNWWTESLHGAQGSVATTVYPEPVGLAATFDASLVKEVASAVSDENRGLHALASRTGKYGRIGTGLDTFSPNINLFRDPRWGRGQETYGEDPYLTARMGVSFIEGMQGPNSELPDIVAVPKHYAVHSGPESTRHEANVFVSPHDLEDTYLPAFRAAIVEGKAGAIMCAYNRVDGQPACVSDLLLKDKLRNAWGFQGLVASDCDAVKDVADNHKYAPDQAAAVAAGLKAGVDNECHNSTLIDVGGLAERYKEAYQRGYISMADIDRALVRLFSARYRTGDLPGIARPNTRPAPGLPLITEERGALSLKASEKSLVLLKNNGILPLKRDGLRIAVVGPLADATRVLRGNYSAQQSSPPISVLAGLKQAMPEAQISTVPFTPSITDGDSVPQSALQTPDGKPGLLAQYYSATSPEPAKSLTWGERQAQIFAMTYAKKPAVTRIEKDVAARGNELGKVGEHHKVVWTGYLVPPETGTYRMGMMGFAGEAVLDNKTVIKMKPLSFSGMPEWTVVKLEKGKRYPLRVTSEVHGLFGVDLLWKRVVEPAEADITAAAANADVVVAVVGLTANLEGEEMPVKVEGFSGGDKTSLDLPSDQRALLEKAKATGKPVVVVVMNGSPVALQWAKENAAAVVEAWYPGPWGGLAVANVLSGKVNPAGRLPLTFYASVKDLPPFDDYSMKGRTYRYFKGTPVYQFGYGLSYTSFAYAPLKVEPVNGSPEKGLKVTTEITNTGARDGDEVAQLYLSPPDFEGAPRPSLRGFARVNLKAGERKTVVFDLSPRDLSFVRGDGVRQIFAGQYTVSVGSGQPGPAAVYQSERFSAAQAVPLPE